MWLSLAELSMGAKTLGIPVTKTHWGRLRQSLGFKETDKRREEFLTSPAQTQETERGRHSTVGTVVLQP